MPGFAWLGFSLWHPKALRGGRTCMENSSVWLECMQCRRTVSSPPQIWTRYYHDMGHEGQHDLSDIRLAGLAPQRKGGRPSTIDSQVV